MCALDDFVCGSGGVCACSCEVGGELEAASAVPGGVLVVVCVERDGSRGRRDEEKDAHQVASAAAISDYSFV